MKKSILIKSIVALVVLYCILVATFEITGVCPEYINRMPKVIMSPEERSGPSLEDVLYKLKLCPLSTVVGVDFYGNQNLKKE